MKKKKKKVVFPVPVMKFSFLQLNLTAKRRTVAEVMIR